MNDLHMKHDMAEPAVEHRHGHAQIQCEADSQAQAELICRASSMQSWPQRNMRAWPIFNPCRYLASTHLRM